MIAGEMLIFDTCEVNQETGSVYATGTLPCTMHDDIVGAEGYVELNGRKVPVVILSYEYTVGSDIIRWQATDSIHVIAERWLDTDEDPDLPSLGPLPWGPRFDRRALAVCAGVVLAMVVFLLWQVWR